MPKNPPPLSRDFLAEIGLIATQWAAIEAAMELAILRIQGIDLSAGLVITSEVGFRQRYNLLMTIANEDGGIAPATEAAALKVLLTRIWAAYPKRNAAVHPLWTGTKNSRVATRACIRAKGRLRVISEPVSIADLKKDAAEIFEIGADLTDFMERNGLTPEGSIQDVL